MVLIEAVHLSKSFGSNQAVDGVDLQVAAGEIYGLMGPDGAGKTTTLRLLCGALRPTSQETTIQIGGMDVVRHPERARAILGYLPQRFSLYEEMTVLENMRFFAEVRGLAAENWKPRCLEILAFVNLEPFVNRRAGNLSGGMKQKLGLAAAMVHQPQVLLLDEPTTGVDPVTRQDFWQLIIRLVAQDQVTVLVTTPYMDEAARCKRVGFMQRGRIVAEGTPESLRQRLEGRIVEVRGQPLFRLRQLVLDDPDVEDVQMFGDRLHLRSRSADAAPLVTRLKQNFQSNGYQAELIRIVPPQLEDVFMALREAQQ
jgi:ABC-2 type transport system ATP-binding protein